MRDFRREGFEEDLQLPAEYSGNRLRSPLVRVGEQVETRQHLEHLCRKVLRGPATRRAVVDLAWICFRVRDEFGNRLRRKGCAHRHDVGESYDAGNRSEIADEIEA